MRNTMKMLLIAMLCLSLLAVVGCGKGVPAPVEPSEQTTTAATETTAETQEETTTEKPVNLVEDPLNNGEGDPTDAMENTDQTKEDDKPGVDIEVDDEIQESTPFSSDGGAFAAAAFLLCLDALRAKRHL